MTRMQTAPKTRRAPTAAQVPALARARRAMNDPIYRLCRSAYAEGGEAALRAVLARYVTPAGVAEILGEAAR